MFSFEFFRDNSKTKISILIIYLRGDSKKSSGRGVGWAVEM
jgi:hypothetical protein